MIGLFLSAAFAAALLPGRAVTAPPCVTDGCWSAVPHLRRFVPPHGLLSAPAAADIQLAHAEGALLVRVSALPPDTQVELLLPSGHALLGEGTHRLELAPSAGLLSLGLRLLGPDGPLVWSPSGTAYAGERFPLLLADGPALGMPLELVRLDAQALVLQAPGADRLTVTREQPAWPARRRGVPDAWSATGRDRVDTAPPPEPGWYRAEAVWDGMDVIARRFYVSPALSVPISVAGVHPAPAVALAASGERLVLTDRSAIIVSDSTLQQAALLLADELARLLGRRLPIRDGRHRSGDILLGGPSSLGRDVPAAIRDHAGAAEGFGLDLRAQAVVAAASPRGAVYGVLAFADAITAAPSALLLLGDQPAIAQRVLYHELNLSRGPMDLTVWRAYLRRVVARGRYNTLFIGVRNSVRLTSQPELAHANALAPNELQALVGEAQVLGLSVYPAFQASGHASWLTASHPELRSSGAAQSVCLRDPATAAVVSAAYREVWELFGRPSSVHIGHDEARWSARQTFGDRRDPHCAGVPSGVLLAESVRWHLDFFADLGVSDAVAWSDMFVEDWNGARTHGALSSVSPEELTLASWSKVGDSLGVLRSQGFSVIRLSTGYYDWKRAGLVAESGQLAGEGLALFAPFPWMVSADTPSSRGLASHWSHVLLAGATAWQPALSADPIAAQLAAAASLSAYQPGAGPSGGPLRVVALSGSAAPGDWPMGPSPFVRLDPTVARQEEPATVSVGGAVAVLSLLQAVELTVGARQDILTRGRTLDTADPIVEVVFRYADGSSAVAGLRYGVDTYDLGATGAAASLWGTTGSADLGGGRRGWRRDVVNPHPDRSVLSVEVEPTRADVRALVFGAAVR